MYKLIKTLALRNHFKFNLAKSNDIRNELRSRRKERALVAAVKSLPKDAVYVRHVYNPDWERLGLQVNLVNLIRDPISRMASWFYFVRWDSKAELSCPGRQRLCFHWAATRWKVVLVDWTTQLTYSSGNLPGRPKPSWRQKTFDSCVMTRDPECQMGGNRYIENFLPEFKAQCFLKIFASGRNCC